MYTVPFVACLQRAYRVTFGWMGKARFLVLRLVLRGGGSKGGGGNFYSLFNRYSKPSVFQDVGPDLRYVASSMGYLTLMGEIKEIKMRRKL